MVPCDSNSFETKNTIPDHALKSIGNWVKQFEEVAIYQECLSSLEPAIHFQTTRSVSSCEVNDRLGLA